eukprot:TRINITY_DN8446_c0_g2_i1.p1 TRINITY_DN8446_c0_g2~~TRINITY_DN8446_c0_g2_i1.p1  ORF type:complete len:216 (+),score=33.91 TRINITY_DN8446_c0_g2_i1:449-1096(+)
MGSVMPSSDSENRQTQVFLNVYDLTPLNNYFYWFGFGIYHSGIEAHGVEYAFGAHDFESSGVFEVEPKSCPGFVFRRSVLLGKTDLSPSEFRQFMEHMALNYYGNTYHLIAKNCNHFTDEISRRATGKPIPGWVNRLARIGSLCNCLLPESIQYTAVCQTPRYEVYSDDESESNSSGEHVVSEGEQDRLLFSSNGETRDDFQQKALQHLNFKEVF